MRCIICSFFNFNLWENVTQEGAYIQRQNSWGQVIVLLFPLFIFPALLLSYNNGRNNMNLYIYGDSKWGCNARI